MPARTQQSLAEAKAKKSQNSQAVEMERLRLLEMQQDKRTTEKKKRDEERKKEEEIRKKAADEQRKEDGTAKSNLMNKMAAEASLVKVVSPAEGSKEQADSQDKIHRLLQLGGLENEKEDDIMTKNISSEDEDSENDEQRSPVKKKGRRKANFADVIEYEESNKHNEKPTKKTSSKSGDSTASKTKVVSKPLKPAIRKTPPHFHTHPRIIIEACIQITGDNPEGKFVHAIQELLRNGQIVDKHFAYAPIKPDGATPISDPSKIPINMTVLRAYFKISSQNGRNPFEQQKVWGKSKKSKDDKFKDPMVYFTMAVATNELPAEVMDRIRQEWGRMGRKMLRVKDLQSFESERIISIFNVRLCWCSGAKQAC
jgi:hypothetical protein